MAIPLPILKYWKLGAALAIILGSFWAGMTWESNKRDAKLLIERNAALEAYEAEASRAYRLSQELEQLRAKRRADELLARRNLDEAIARSGTYSLECIDDSGMLILNEALSPRKATGERNDSLPAPNSVTRENR